MSKKPKIGLALSSGGSRGLVHIGVIKALVENDISIDAISGSSAGSLIGGIYSVTANIDFLIDLLDELNYKKLFKIFFDPTLKGGIVRGKKAVNFITRHLPENPAVTKTKIPFYPIATNILTSQSVIVDFCDLATAIRASCSIPLILPPVSHQGMLLVDGGASIPVPAPVLRQKKCDLVIASTVYPHFFPKPMPKKRARATFTTTASYQSMLYQLSLFNVKSADIVISPPVPKVNMFNFVAGKSAIDMGYQATLKQIPKIKKLISHFSKSQG